MSLRTDCVSLSEIRQSISNRNEFQSYAIVAPALAPRWRAIVENMALMSSAAYAMVFDTKENEGEILFGFDAPCNRLSKTGPSSAAVILMPTFKQW